MYLTTYQTTDDAHSYYYILLTATGSNPQYLQLKTDKKRIIIFVQQKQRKCVKGYLLSLFLKFTRQVSNLGVNMLILELNKMKSQILIFTIIDM